MRQLVGELVARAAAAGALRVAALDDEPGDDPVEDDAVEVVVAGQHHEVVDGLWRHVRVECDRQRAATRHHLRRVALVDVDAHRRRFLELLRLLRSFVVVQQAGDDLGRRRLHLAGVDPPRRAVD